MTVDAFHGKTGELPCCQFGAESSLSLLFLLFVFEVKYRKVWQITRWRPAGKGSRPPPPQTVNLWQPNPVPVVHQMAETDSVSSTCSFKRSHLVLTSAGTDENDLHPVAIMDPAKISVSSVMGMMR
jgi:hypothetical protein